MVGFRHVATVTGAGYLSNITDLSIATVGGQQVLYSATHVGGGITAMQIGPADAGVTIIGATAYGAGVSYTREPRVNVMQMGGASVVAMTDTGSSLMAMRIAPSGAVSPADPAPATALRQLGGGVVAIGQFKTVQGEFTYATRENSTTVTLFQARPDGALAPVAQSAAAPGPVQQGARLDHVLPVEVDGRQVLLTLSSLGDFITTHVVAASGAIQRAAVLMGPESPGFAIPRTATAVTIEGQTYVVIGASASSSLTVFRLAGDGALTALDHVIDEGSTRFHRVTALDSVMLDGRAYVFAGGADDGISMFMLRPDGILVHLQSLADEHALTLARVSAIKAQVIGGRIVLFVASATEEGITQLVIEPGPAGITGVVAGTTPQGTDRDDYMIAGAEAIWMGGGPGNDTLAAAGNPIALVGGPGADTFVPSNIRGRIAIRDFQPGVDRLDFSHLGMVRSIYQLTIQPQTWGARVRYHETVLDIYTSGGTTLPVDFFTNDMFPITHYKPPPPRVNLVGTAGNDQLWAGESGGTIRGGAGHDVILGSAHADVLHGDAGNDTIRGEDGDDSIHGGDGDDRLRGGHGNDLILGGPGHDVLWGDEGDDSLLGEDGNDTLFGGSGRDTLRGGAGNDHLFGGPDDDLLHGDAGDDRLEGEGGRDTLYGGPGNDTLIGGPGDDLLYGDDGNDWLSGDDGNDTLHGGPGSDTLNGGAGADRLFGGSGNDRLLGGAGDDSLSGDAGHDTLIGGAGNDTLRGGTGNDRLEGGTGNDMLYGAGGADRLYGGAGRDSLYGGAGADSLWGQGGNDLIYGDGGKDVIYGGAGHDTLYGGAGNDWLSGGAGRDGLYGGTGRDTLYGDGGNDRLDGGAGNDRLFGGAGNDTLRGGRGADMLNGGAGRDVFFYGEVAESSRRHGIDVIEDFTRRQDRIDLSAMDFTFIGNAAFSGARQLRAVHESDRTVLYGDVNGDRVADFQLILLGAIPIDHTDLLL